MPKELGKPKKADMSGHFAGEQLDAVAPLVRFLVNARQISELEDGHALGNGDTARGIAPSKSSDTEAYAPIMARAEGNGQAGNGNGHGGNGHTGNGQTPSRIQPQLEASLSPEPAMEVQPATDLFGDPISVEPDMNETQLGTETAIDIAPVSSSDTVHDLTLRSEPEVASLSIDSVSPEVAPLSLDATEPGMDMGDMSSADTVFDTRLDRPEQTFSMAPQEAVLDQPKKESEARTRILSRTPELAVHEQKIETGNIAKPSIDVADNREVDDETAKIKGGDSDPEKVTTKVDPKSAASQAPQGGVVRDTVNFYNQTQALRDLLDSDQRPVPRPRPQEAAAIAPLPAIDEISNDTLEPPDIALPAIGQHSSLASEPQPAHDEQDEQTRAFMLADLAPAHSATSEETHAPDLSASEDHASADRKDTDRFNLADMRPADLAAPEGTDKIDKSALGSDEDAMRVADEEVASHRDTQRFFVSDLVGIATFKPAPKPVPLAEDDDKASAGSDTSLDLTSSGSTTGAQSPMEQASPPSQKTITPEKVALPVDVREDFSPPPAHLGICIVPELGGAKPVTPSTRAAAVQSGEKITEKVKPEKPVEPAVVQDTDKLPVPAKADTTVKKITDALTRRLRQERDETKKLIDEAEGVLLRLRQTPVSARLPKVEESPVLPEAEAELPEPEAQDEPQPEPEPAEHGLPPLEDISSATVHDLRLAEELLAASKALEEAKAKVRDSARYVRQEPEPQPQSITLRDAFSGQTVAPLSRPIEKIPGPAAQDSRRLKNPLADPAEDVLSRIEQRLGGASRSLDEIVSSTSAALARVTGEITREEIDERRRQRDEQKSNRSRRQAPKPPEGLADDWQDESQDEPPPEPEGFDPYAGLSIDELVSATSSPRRAAAEFRLSDSRRHTASGRTILEEEPVSRRTSARLQSASLSDELGRVLAEAAKSRTRIHNASPAASIAPEEGEFEFTQGPLWQTLVGIAVITGFLTVLFICVWYMIVTRGA